MRCWSWLGSSSGLVAAICLQAVAMPSIEVLSWRSAVLTWQQACLYACMPAQRTPAPAKCVQLPAPPPNIAAPCCPTARCADAEPLTPATPTGEHTEELLTEVRCVERLQAERAVPTH